MNKKVKILKKNIAGRFLILFVIGFVFSK